MAMANPPVGYITQKSRPSSSMRSASSAGIIAVARSRVFFIGSIQKPGCPTPRWARPAGPICWMPTISASPLNPARAFSPPMAARRSWTSGPNSSQCASESMMGWGSCALICLAVMVMAFPPGCRPWRGRLPEGPSAGRAPAAQHGVPGQAVPGSGEPAQLRAPAAAASAMSSGSMPNRSVRTSPVCSPSVGAAKRGPWSWPRMRNWWPA